MAVIKCFLAPIVYKSIDKAMGSSIELDMNRESLS